jgi:hypothetical protein
LLLGFFLTFPALAQDPLSGPLTMGLGDVAAIKKRAEAGDAAAQVALGGLLFSRSSGTEALQWFRKAAIQGNVEGEYNVGQMLLYGHSAFQNYPSVEAAQIDGLRWTFIAATNHYPRACWNMSQALLQGIGTTNNPVAAYAWLKLYSETSEGGITGRVQMNYLALKMTTDDLERAQNLATQFKSGHYEFPVVQLISEGDSRLKLSGITISARMSLAVINGKTLSEGESTSIKLKAGNLSVKCLKIERNSVLVSIEGEDQPRILRLSH